VTRRSWWHLFITAFAIAAISLSACSAGAPNQAGTSGQASQSTSPQVHAGGSPQPAAPIDWKAVDQAIGKPGAMQPGDVYKFSLPRSDLQVTVRGVQIKPALALGTWLAFKQRDDETVMMGDLVLAADEVNPVITKLQQGGIEQTALHKHLPDELPPVWWMHIGGQGDPVQLAETVRAALELTATPFDQSDGGAESQDLGIDTQQLDQIVGHKGKASGGVYHLSIPRADTITMDGIDIPPAMGTANALNFQPTGGGRAAINGDFVLLAEEVNPVLATLREHGIEAVALHNHMLTEEPHLFFVHFWTNYDAVTLARGLRAALDQTNATKGAA
jgi:hypothetical protein